MSTTWGPRTMLRAAARPTGMLLGVLAIAMALCAVVGLVMGAMSGAFDLGVSAAICGVVAGLLMAWGSVDDARLGRREALVIVTLAWLSAGVFGGLPFVVGGKLSVADAFFEAMSGFTTTGATVLTEIETHLDEPLHLWRMATHWLGGMGIVVLFVAIFPALGVGGKHLFRTEAAGPPTTGLQPRVRETAFALWRVYFLLTLVCVGLLLIAGLSPFDAVVHAMSTLGTGGYSNKNASLGAFGLVQVEMVVLVFMLLAGTNFALFHQAFRDRSLKVFWNNVEWRVYMGLWGLCTLVIMLDLRSMIPNVADGFRYASFQVATIMTTTGFGTADYEQWPSLSKSILVVLYFVGGSSGSTAGGMKIIRIVILFQVVWGEIRRGFRPSLVTPARVGRQVVPQGVVMGTLAYAAVFAMTVAATALLVAFFDQVDLTTAFMASLACVANVGPGLGLVGPTDNFGFFSGVSKVLLSFAMLLGRLEFFTLLALFVPGFWRR